MKICQYLTGRSFILHDPMWGSSVSSSASECFIEWLSESSFCLMNFSALTHVCPNGVCSLIDLLLCSSDLLTCSSVLILAAWYDRDHFQIVISVDIHSPVQPGSSLYKWSLICREDHANLQWVSDFDYETFQTLILSAMSENFVFRSRPSKCLPSW